MFRKILVALDRSRNAEQVLEAAIALAKAEAANLMLLHVLSSEEEGYPQLPTTTALDYCPLDIKIFEDYQKRRQEYEKQGLELLQSHADKATAAGMNAEFTQTSGSSGRTICEMAQNWGADLIVIGRRGLSGVNELVLGSVSNYVLHHARCSVFTVQEQAQPKIEISQDRQGAMVS